MDNYFTHHEPDNYSKESFALNICEMVFKSGKGFPIDLSQLSVVLKQQGLDYSDYGFTRCKDLFLSLPDFFKSSYPIPTIMMIDLTPKMKKMLYPDTGDSAFDSFSNTPLQPIYNAKQTLTIPQEAHSVQLQHVEDVQRQAPMGNPEIKSGHRQPAQGSTPHPNFAAEQDAELPPEQQAQARYFSGQKQRNILQEFFSHSAADQRQFVKTLNRFVYMRSNDVTAAHLIILTQIESLSATGWGNVLAFSYMLALNENRIAESKDGAYMCFDTLITDIYGEPIYFLAERSRFPGTYWVLKGIGKKSSRVVGQIIQDDFPF